MKIAVASDHGGFALKELVKKHLEQRNLEVLDLGTHSEESVDYPVYGRRCAEAVASGEADLGVVCCGTGIGISITANKFKGIRAALCSDCFSAEATRLHNDANILALGGRVVGPGLAVKIVDTFLNTPFSEEERHIRRIKQIEEDTDITDPYGGEEEQYDMCYHDIARRIRKVIQILMKNEKDEGGQAE